MPEGITWSISLILIMLGLLGLVIPVLPGLPLVYLGTALHKFAFFTAHPISSTAFWILTGIFVAAQVAEIIGGVAGAASVGLTRWGVFGGIIGLVIGLFFGLPGIIFGPLSGIFIGQMCSGQELNRAVRVALAFGAGTLIGFAIKCASSLAMIGVLIWAVWW